MPGSVFFHNWEGLPMVRVGLPMKNIESHYSHNNQYIDIIMSEDCSKSVALSAGWYVSWHMVAVLRSIARFNTLRPRQNGRHFADAIFKCIFLNENIWISIQISLKFVPRGSVNNIPALVQIMTCRRPGDKPLSELMMASLLTHICVTRPQWVKLPAWSPHGTERDQRHTTLFLVICYLRTPKCLRENMLSQYVTVVNMELYSGIK